MNKRSIGSEGEELAVQFLMSKGVKILDRNFSAKGGEVDIIFLDEGYLVFAEVKYRIGSGYGDPLDAIDYNKVKHLIHTARFYLYKNHYSETTPVRFDAISILNGKLEWIKNAFET